MTTLDAGAAFAVYRIESMLHEGTRTRVFRARQDDLNRNVVLHVAIGDSASDDANQLVALGRRLSALDDPHVIRVFEAGIADGVAYAAAADVGGRELNKVLADGPLTPAAATAIAAQLAPAFDGLHSAAVEVPAATVADVVVVGQGHSSQAYVDVLRAYGRPRTSGFAPVESLAGLLETMLADRAPGELRSVLSATESFPSAVALAQAAGAAVTRDRPARRRSLGAVAAVGLTAAILGAAVLVAGERDDGGVRTSAARPDAPAARLVATIPLGGTPGSSAIGDDAVWVATVEGNVLRIDPRTDKVVGAPIRFAPKDMRNNVTIRAGGGLLFAIDGNRGTIVRIEQRSGRITGRVRLHGVVSGATVSDGVVWTLLWRPLGAGATAELVRIDASTLRPAVPRVPLPDARRIGPDDVDVEASRDVAWVSDSGNGTVTRYDRATNDVTTVKVGGAAVDGALNDGRLWIPDVTSGALVPLDARTMRLPDTVLHPDYPLSVASGAGALWVEAQRNNTGPGGPMRLYRVDPRRRAVLGRPVELGSDLGWLTAGFGAVWVRSSPKQALLKLVPTSPPPAARPVRHPEGSPRPLVSGPLGRGAWATRAFTVPFTVSVATSGWLLIQDNPRFVEFDRSDAPRTDAFVGTPTQVFAPSGRVVDLRTPRQALDLIASNRRIEVGQRRKTTFGGLPATAVTLRARATRHYPEFCWGPCVALFGFPGSTLGLQGAGVTRLWVLRHAGRVVVGFAERDAQNPGQGVPAKLLGTLRFR